MATSPVSPAVANTHIRDNFQALLEPGLRKIFFETYKEVPEQFSKLYNVLTSSKATETDYGMGAFGDWTEKTTEVEAITYQKLSERAEAHYTHKTFTSGFMISREMYDDDQYKQMTKMSKALARSGRAFIEKQAMIPIKNAFTVNGYDGVPLISNAHPLADADGVFGKNLVTGALSEETLETALRIMRETVDEAGNIIGIKAKKLFIPPALEYTARKLMESQQVVGSANNDKNVIKGVLDIVVMDYMGASAGGSDTAWFIQADYHEMNFFWRVKPEFKGAEDFDSLVAKYRGYERFSCGYSDWRGMVGSTGATE